MTMTLRYVARSDVGLVREENEDSGYAGPRLLAVADGMGGHAAGEIASSATIEELVHLENGRTDADPIDALSAAVVSANDRIRELITDDPRREGMGTTLTALLWTGQDFRVAHIGDSRAYLLRDGALRQLTHDHTFVQTLVDDGRITPDQAGVHPARSLILKALDGRPGPEVDLDVVPAELGDRLLLCSDGLSGVVSDDTLRDTLGRQTNLEATADALVQLAMRGGAPDNITVVVAEVVETDHAPGPDDTAEAYLVGAASGEQRPRPSRRRSRRRLLSPGMPRLDEGPGPADDPEVLRYAPRPPRRFRWLRRLAVVAVLGVVVWAAAALASDWVRGQYYVGDQAGEVAIFNGVSQEVGPLQLSRLHSIADGLPVGALPDLYRDQVHATITADTLPEAERIVAELRREACAAHEPSTPEPVTSDGSAGSDSPTAADEAGHLVTDPEPLPTAPPGYPGLDCSGAP